MLKENNAEKVELFTVGAPDNSFGYLIDIIDSYETSANFIHWISDGDFVFNVIRQEIVNGKFMKIDQYFIQDVLVFNGKLTCDLDQLSEEQQAVLTGIKGPYYSYAPGISIFHKVQVSRVVSEPHYTVISDFQVDERSCGLTWEIYELPDLAEIYKQKKDPFRHWRSDKAP